MKKITILILLIAAIGASETTKAQLVDNTSGCDAYVRLKSGDASCNDCTYTIFFVPTGTVNMAFPAMCGTSTYWSEAKICASTPGGDRCFSGGIPNCASVGLDPCSSHPNSILGVPTSCCGSFGAQWDAANQKLEIF